MGVEEDSKEDEIIMKKIQQVQKEKSEDFHHFRLFSYLSMTVLSIAILVGMFVILQHFNEEEITKDTLANQQTLIQNQQLLKQLLNDAKGHEIREEAILGNTTSTNLATSQANSERLEKIMKYLNITD